LGQGTAMPVMSLPVKNFCKLYRGKEKNKNFSLFISIGPAFIIR